MSCPSLLQIPRVNDKAITLDTPQGAERVTPLRYIEDALALQPDAVVAMCDEGSATTSDKKLGQALKRSLAWLDSCIDELKGRIPLFAPLAGGSDPKLRAEWREEVMKRDESVAGEIGSGVFSYSTSYHDVSPRWQATGSVGLDWGSLLTNLSVCSRYPWKLSLRTNQRLWLDTIRHNRFLLP